MPLLLRMSTVCTGLLDSTPPCFLQDGAFLAVSDADDSKQLTGYVMSLEPHTHVPSTAAGSFEVSAASWRDSGAAVVMAPRTVTALYWRNHPPVCPSQTH